MSDNTLCFTSDLIRKFLKYLLDHYPSVKKGLLSWD